MANLFSKSKAFISASYEELKKVSTPSMSETKKITFMTIVIVVIVALTIFLMDLVFNNVSRLIIPTVVD